jgi:hypothetical protein
MEIKKGKKKNRELLNEKIRKIKSNKQSAKGPGGEFLIHALNMATHKKYRRISIQRQYVQPLSLPAMM